VRIGTEGIIAKLPADIALPSSILDFIAFPSKDTVEERDEQAEFENGPLSVLMQSVKQNSQVYPFLWSAAFSCL
jgi:hypothetical protein